MGNYVFYNRYTYFSKTRLLTLRRKTEIEAPPETVWNILTDFKAYPDWNHSVKRIRGRLKVGERITIRFRRSKGGERNRRLRIIRLVDNIELAWKENLMALGLCKGEQIFYLERIAPCRTLLIQLENFTGLLAGLSEGSIYGRIARSFEKMNQALKKQAEYRTARSRKIISKKKTGWDSDSKHAR